MNATENCELKLATSEERVLELRKIIKLTENENSRIRDDKSRANKQFESCTKNENELRLKNDLLEKSISDMKNLVAEKDGEIMNLKGENQKISEAKMESERLVTAKEVEIERLEKKILDGEVSKRAQIQQLEDEHKEEVSKKQNDLLKEREMWMERLKAKEADYERLQSSLEKMSKLRKQSLLDREKKILDKLMDHEEKLRDGKGILTGQILHKMVIESRQSIDNKFQNHNRNAHASLPIKGDTITFNNLIL